MADDRPDAELAARAAQRDTAALGELYRRHAAAVLAFLAARLPRADAEDIHQTTWLRVWERVARFDGTHFRGWLFTIARNLLEDHRRKRRETALPDDAAPITKARPEDVLLDDERRRVLAECLDRLPLDRAELVRARLGGEDYPALAQRLGLSNEQVHRRFHSAKEQLQTCVEQKMS